MKPAWWLSLAFAALCFFGLAHHELWRDELQAWSLVRDNGALPGIFHDLHYEGHPCLWYLLLYAVSRVTSDPHAMQVLQGLIATGSMFVFLRFCPWGWAYKLLFMFGYFPFYEYAVKSRGYALGMLLMFGACALWERRRTHYIAIAILVFLLAQTSPMGMLMAAALGAGLLADYLRPRPDETRHRGALAGVLVAITGLVLAVVQILPPSGGGFVSMDSVPKGGPADLVRAFSVISKAYFQTLNLFAAAHESHAVFLLRAGLDLALAALALLVFGRSFLKRTDVLAVYVTGNALTLLAFAATNLYNPWHYGYLFLLLTACLWMNGAAGPGARSGKDKLAAILLAVVLGCQAVAGVRGYVRDLALPYSEARQTAEFITSHGMADMPMVGDMDSAASAVAGYLNRPMYYPKRKDWGIHILWRPNEYSTAGIQETISAAREVMNARKQDVLLVLNYEPPPDTLPPSIHPAASFTTSIEPTERFYLYTVKKTGTH